MCICEDSVSVKRERGEMTYHGVVQGQHRGGGLHETCGWYSIEDLLEGGLSSNNETAEFDPGDIITKSYQAYEARDEEAEQFFSRIVQVDQNFWFDRPPNHGDKSLSPLHVCARSRLPIPSSRLDRLLLLS